VDDLGQERLAGAGLTLEQERGVDRRQRGRIAKIRRIAGLRPRARPQRSSTASGSRTRSSPTSKRSLVWPSSMIAPGRTRARSTPMPPTVVPLVEPRSDS
jgi:hypothetical protein